MAAVAADLISDAPAPERKGELAAFEPLIGSWDLRYIYRKASGDCIEGTGYAHFGWGLRGTAMVDIWAFDSGVAGTTIRYYDAQIDRFRSTWICPARNALVPFIGRVVDGKIVLNALANDPPGRRLRWSFVSISSEHFSWTGEVCDDGATWLLVQEIEGSRHA
jgi:hypothetical protein